MESRELTDISNVIFHDVGAIIHSQQVLAGVHAELDKNQFRPFEQDYIYQEHYGTIPSQPRKMVINGVTITSRVLHQTGIGLQDVNGADLLYEIEGEKFGLIQYKRSNTRGVKGDAEQLQKLLSNCPEKCIHFKRRPIPKDWLPLKTNSFCGAWYSVIDENGEQKFVHACEAETIFKNSQSVQNKEFDFGLSKSTFLELFSSCRVGALVRIPLDKRVKDGYLESLLAYHHLIFEIVQKGKWSVK